MAGKVVGIEGMGMESTGIGRPHQRRVATGASTAPAPAATSVNANLRE